MRASPKAKTVFVCTECGDDSPKWLGRCPACGAWSTLVERREPAGGVSRITSNVAGDQSAALPIREVGADAAQRIETGIAELDRVLGGGPVLGGVVLLGGDPGIGKSTLLMQALAGIARSGRKALYVTGEESAAQVALRARRLGGPGMEDIVVQATLDLDEVVATIDKLSPAAVVVDSVQTVRVAGLETPAGSVGQLREVAARLVEIGKRRGIAMFLIGHVTKDGAIAGPKLLEHLVDTVLTFEGDATASFRIVRATKNRFGPAHEMAVFEMVRDGLREVASPSALFLRERPSRAAGSVVTPIAEGSRPVLVEVQALVAPPQYGPARRVATGVDGSRLAILLAVLERKAEVHVLDRDVFASVAGGAHVDERAADLAIAIAVVSSLRDRAIDTGLAVFGEVGLAGELRAVPRGAARVQEARAMGFTRVLMPRGNASQLTEEERAGMEILGVPGLAEAMQHAFE
ncbi:MAG: DNA repair protein RadA [Sandaracinus sp.]